MNINATLLGQMITFGLLVVFTMKYVWPPLVQAMAERQKRIADGFAAAEKGKRELQLAEKRSTDMLREAKEKASEIITHAEKRAAELSDEAKVHAKTEAERILASARGEIDQEIIRAREELRGRVADLVVAAAGRILEKEIDAKAHMQSRVELLREQNPMLGLRGVRLGIMRPNLTRMQVRAIFEAACVVTREGIEVHPEVMIPLTAHTAELARQRAVLEEEAQTVMEEHGLNIDYKFGTMIEVPRAALTADQIELDTGSITTTGDVTLRAESSARVINLGTEVGGELSFTQAEIANVIDAGTLRIGDTNGGAITVTDAITIGVKVRREKSRRRISRTKKMPAMGALNTEAIPAAAPHPSSVVVPCGLVPMSRPRLEPMPKRK